MKNTILIFILVTMSQVTIAQIQKGAGYFGGQLSGYSNNGENPQTSLTSEYENSNWNFNISYGHYLTDNFAIGLGAGIGLSDFKEDNAGPNYHNTYEQDATMYYFTPFVRFSKKITDNFYCYGNFQIQIGNGTTDCTYTSLNSGETTSKSSVSNLGGALTGGLNYFLNRHFAFSLTISPCAHWHFYLLSKYRMCMWSGYISVL